MLSGIDVSAAGQGPNFPWASYRGKIDFAGVKISEGLTFADPDAARNIAGARSIGVPVIGYHFVHASLGGAPQARWFLECCAKAGIRKGDLLAVDVEDGGLDGLSATQMDLVAAGFANWVHPHQEAWPVCYTEISMAPALVHMGNCPVWPANPSQVQVPLPLGPWKSISFEQTGQRGVDLDVFYGDQAELAKLAIPG